MSSAPPRGGEATGRSAPRPAGRGARGHRPPAPGLAVRPFWPVLLAVLLADCGTKELAEQALVPGVPREAVGDLVRWTLSYNVGPALGLPAAPGVRLALGLLGLVAVAWVVRSARGRPGRWGVALALIGAGALGNALQRLLAPRGVVDFIDVGYGTHRFFIFNVADVALFAGALALAFLAGRRTAVPT